MRARLKNWIRTDPNSGATLVEFALTFPFLILLLMGIFDLGWAVYANNTVALAAREGARQAIITTTSDSVIRAQVKNTAQGLSLTDSEIVINPSPTRTSGSAVSVQVNYTYTPVTPLIANIIGGGSLHVSSQATMIVE
jgi:Flp pilus assembly protein TadG